jgi:hypothetical protein
MKLVFSSFFASSSIQNGWDGADVARAQLDQLGHAA